MKFTLLINNQAQKIDVNPDMPLLWALRNQLHLTGTKYGCGIGQCGSCTVHLDGKAIRVCQPPVSTIGNGNITTIEGESPDTDCTRYNKPGWIRMYHSTVTASPARLWPSLHGLNAYRLPGDADIDSAMAGNLCRCSTYSRIKQAIRQVVTDTQHPEKRCRNRSWIK